MKSSSYLFTTLIGSLLSITATAHAQLAAPQVNGVTTAFYLTADNPTINKNPTIAQDSQDQNSDQSTTNNNSNQSDTTNDNNMDDNDTMSNDDSGNDSSSSTPTYDSQNNDVPDSTGSDTDNN